MLRRAEDLLLDCLASILAGASAPAVLAIERYAAAMGPADGPSEVLITRRRTTPLFAAMVNAAAAHVVEQDDVHNGSVFHPPPWCSRRRWPWPRRWGARDATC